ncbi:MAG: PAS domain-containing protein [Nitrospirae bacterium]|nr:PAS domain-containing protein [Nitrospirota bacterium]
MTPELMILYSIFVLIIAILIFYLIRMFIKYFSAKKKTEEKDMSKVSFVVDTFHELVAKLKEKEKELELLRKKAEDKVVAIEGYNENILQSVPSGVISFDNELKITKINQSAEKILGISSMDTTGKFYYEVFKDPVKELIHSRKIIERQEINYITPHGRRIWLGLTLSPLRDSNGLPIGQILVFTDLTHLKAIESQIQLRDKLSSLGEISAGIAHELRNPMGVIAGYTKILSKKSDESLMPIIDAISKEISVMDRIISDFLSFSKPANLAITDIDIKMLIEDCVKALAVERNDIKKNLELDNLPAIRGDEVLLRQAFINLIQNAIEAMPSGGNLNVKGVTVHTHDGEFLDILISDTGHGISEDLRSKIFLPFFTTKEKGTGLGLAIVHKIIISHGGNITVDSTQNGTTFRIRLRVK